MTDFLLVQRIREEFEYWCGLRLSLDEASRFWALERSICEAVLRQLLVGGVIVRASDERFELKAA